MIDPKHAFYTVRCSNPKCPSRLYKRGGKRREDPAPDGLWLGEIQIDVPNTSKHRCHSCNTIYRHTISADGSITRDVSKEHTVTSDTVARIEVVAP